MIEFKVVKKRKFKFLCLIAHNWKKQKETKVTTYWKCLRCGRKEIIQLADEYEEIDFDFLN